MALQCGDNMFGGNTKASEFYDPASTAGPLIAYLVASSVAFGKAMTEINEEFELPCPATCTAKLGEYALKVDIRFTKPRERHAVECHVRWITVVRCNPGETVTPKLVLMDFDELTQYISDVSKTTK